MEEHMETMEDYKAELEASFRRISEGDIVTATVIAVSEEEATLDLKYYAPGIIKATDLSDDPDYSILQNLHPGDEIQATVICTDDGDGNIVLSKKEANRMLGWEKLKTAMEQETILTVSVKEAVNAGVVTYAEGLRAFIPASQLSLDYVEDPSVFIGKDLEVRVITVDAQKEKLVLSAKSVLKERAEEERNHRISMLVPGTVVEGTVESLTNYGAFVNIGNGLTGLVHVSQICERRIRKPSEVLKVGQNVRAKILNTNDNRIALSIRALEEITESDADESAQAAEYHSNESASTSLGDLIAKLHLK
ncbi:30S ribosomal protein S1 [Eubacterium plexicaudatum ASF492]|uniref:S1 motif domain-containing protein n=1 Tax=Eubacterium plexicaudatum ASF492 TaxID=1235802 RepID=N2BDK4_9FIRM|nr:30S ribosomal protein S1 [Eubacterium plexicaudatum ASF492]